MTRAKWGFIGLAAGLLWMGPATADVTNFLGDLVGGKSAAAEFAGTWNLPGTATGDIDHVVVTAPSSGPVRIQVFGRCEARICNWGALPARVRTDGPASESVRSLSADFNLGFALRHITLHRLAGNTLRYDMVTEFTDGSDRHDYEAAGQLVPAGTKLAAAPAPVPGAAPTTAPSATPSAAPAPLPAAAPPPPPSTASSGSSLNPLNWFSSKPAAPPAPAVAPAVVPIDNSEPVAVSTAIPVDDCFTIDTGHVYLAPANGNWNLRDFLHVVQGFGPYRNAAVKALTVLQFYKFDEICHIGRGSTNMMFFRAAGDIPHQPMSGADCTDVHPDQVAAVKRDDAWKVVDGTRELYDYGSDEQGAAQAVVVIKSLALSHQCFYDRANIQTSYWLAR